MITCCKQQHLGNKSGPTSTGTGLTKVWPKCPPGTRYGCCRVVQANCVFCPFSLLNFRNWGPFSLEWGSICWRLSGQEVPWDNLIIWWMVTPDFEVVQFNNFSSDLILLVLQLLLEFLVYLGCVGQKWNFGIWERARRRVVRQSLRWCVHSMMARERKSVRREYGWESGRGCFPFQNCNIENFITDNRRCENTPSET